MLKLLASLVVILAAASTASGQIKSTVTNKLALLGVTSPELQGNRILVGADSNIAVSSVVILTIETDYKFKRIKAYRDGQRVEPEVTSDTSYLFAGAGKYLVSVTVFDPEKGIDDAEFTFEIDGKPEPPKPPKPPEPPTPPQPDGPFDNLAKRVAEIAAKISQADRERYGGTMQEVCAMMESFQIKRAEDARKFIASKNLPSVELNALLYDDSKNRQMGFQETLNWYREVLKGVR